MFIDSDVLMACRPSGGGMYEPPDMQPHWELFISRHL